MASGPRRPLPPYFGAEDPSRLHLRAIRELPSGQDAEVASIFRDMRQATGLTVPLLAFRLRTTERTIEALEEGALLALPEWPETSRVIMAYAAMLNLDARPVLRRIHAQLMPQAPLRDAATMPPAHQPPAQPGPNVRRTPPQPRRRSRILKWVPLLAMVVTATVGAFLAVEKPQLIVSVTDRMPDPIPKLARFGIDLLRPVGQAVTRSDDPRSRKADKLVPGDSPVRR